MDLRVAAFTDTYLPTVNGVSYTIQCWQDRWTRRGGRMDVAYPKATEHDPGEHEHPIRSLRFPFYDGYRLGVPQVPAAVRGADVVHAHTPFGVGLGGLRLARRSDAPLVASYHTPAGEYTNYLAPTSGVADHLERVTDAYERWFLERADVVVAPTDVARRQVLDLGVDTPVRVVPNGVDVERFTRVDPTAFVAAHDLPTDRPLVGYTGRHGYEKHLSELVEAAAEMDVTVVLGGDGPARPELESLAERRGADVRFLGFLDRDDLPAFYSAIDVFAFPSPIETQGLVALEANACGTPVVGVDSGALVDTIEDGRTGYHYDAGDVAAFRDALGRVLDERDHLADRCLDHRDSISVERAIDRLADVYHDLL